MPHIEMRSIWTFYEWLKNHRTYLGEQIKNNKHPDKFESGRLHDINIVIDEYESRFQWLKDRDQR